MPLPATTATTPVPPREIAPFLKSLRAMLDSESPEILSWTPDGRAFEIRDVQALTKTVLPKYFKHAKYASFQRQLNYFRFRKWTKSRAAVCTFANPYFVRDEPHLSGRILRKRSLGDMAAKAAQVPPPSSTGSLSSDDSASLCESPHGHDELDMALHWIDAVFPSLEMLSALGQDDMDVNVSRLPSAMHAPRRRDAPMPRQSVEYVAW